MTVEEGSVEETVTERSRTSTDQMYSERSRMSSIMDRRRATIHGRRYYQPAGAARQHFSVCEARERVLERQGAEGLNMRSG